MTTSGATEAVERILNRGGDARTVLRAVAAALHDHGIAWVAIRSHGEDVATAGSPSAGAPSVPIRYEGREVGELEAAINDTPFLERVATLVSAYLRDAGRVEPWAP